ncbi:protein LURP-one-related 8-like [Primulina eburnea]|uniref:protein LURP-one-related 8-like n=1 Tax=Primulina eburnea TaxID=1245227 RepID=UPI003C6C4ECC
MLLFLKSSSRTVHHYPDQESGIEINNYSDDIDHQRCCTSLTVWSKSLVFGCNGFTVIGSDGSLAYRVDNYSDNPNQIVLMDGSGNPIFTICRRKKLRLIDDNWLVYNGEVGKYSDKSSRKPIFCVKKNVNILKTKKLSAIAYVYNDGSTASSKRCAYTIEGSYKHRSCKILDETGQVVAEIKRKQASTGGVSFGLEVFVLVVNAAFDPGFAMAIVLLLDQMFH